MDYAYSQGVEGRTANEISAVEYVDVPNLCSQYIGQCSVQDVQRETKQTYDQFKMLYRRAWEGGSKDAPCLGRAGREWASLTSGKGRRGGRGLLY